MNTLLLILAIEGGIVAFALLLLLINVLSENRPQGYNLPRLAPVITSLRQRLTALVLGIKVSVWQKLQQDFILVYKRIEPELFTSADGNTLYLSTKLTANWTTEQVLLYMLAHRKEFIDQVKAKDVLALEAFNALLDKLSVAKIEVKFANMNYLPTFSKDVVVWKLPLIDQPVLRQAIHDIIVKELPLS